MRVFRNFSKKYCKLKLLIFDYCNDLLDNFLGVYVMKSNGETLLFIRDDTGASSIPRRFFRCCMSASASVPTDTRCSRLLRLAVTLGFLVFPFFVIRESQIFGEMTDAGEAS